MDTHRTDAHSRAIPHPTSQPSHGARVQTSLPHRPRAVPQPHDHAHAARTLIIWLRTPESVERVRAAIDASTMRRPRRYLPRSVVGKRLAASLILDVANAAVDGVEAAQLMLAYAPRILLAKHAPILTHLHDLMFGTPDAHCDSGAPHADTRDAYHARVRNAVVATDLRGLNRLLADGPSCSVVDRVMVQRVVDARFPYKPAGEVETWGGEQQAISDLAELCGGLSPLLSQRELIRWARAKRDRAADASGYSGRLILELHSVDPAVTAALARAWSVPPEQWVSREAAVASWRILRGAFIPQPTKPLPRPVATASVPRRAWGGAVVRSVRDTATKFCERRGQYGLSRAGGQTAYVIAAQAIVAMGGDVVVDDRTNSFHEVHRSAVYGGVTAYVNYLPPEQRESHGRPLVELVKRTFAGDVAPSQQHASLMDRSTYVFSVDGVAPRTHHALCQGSSESSLLEALTYAQHGPRMLDRAVRCELHDDGYTAAFPDAPIHVFRRPPTSDGSRVAEGKDKAVGPRAQSIVSNGFSAATAQHVLIAGVPVGDIATGLAQWEQRFRRKLDRIREIAAIDVALAAAAAAAVGGPAGMANHVMRCLRPTPDAMAVWRRVDAQWVEMWCDILRLSPCERSPANLAMVRDRLFLQQGSIALHQASAAESAELRYAQGVADAVGHLDSILSRAGRRMDRPLWDALGVTGWRKGSDPVDATGWSPGRMYRAATERVAACRERILVAEAARLQRIRLACPSLAHASDSDSAAPNLLVAWLRLPHVGGVARMPARDGLVALRRLFHLPIPGPATGIRPPRSCLRCGAAAISNEDGYGPGARPRAAVDCFGEHALTCARAGGETQRRHNDLAYAIRDSIDAAGWRATCAAGRVFDAHRGRPADVWVDNHPVHRGGFAIDCTIVTTAGRPRGSAARIAEDAKRRKYQAEVERHPGMGFAPFGVDLDGGIGPTAWEQIRQWARAQACAPDATRTYPEALQWVIGNLARAFVSGCVRQIRAFEERQWSGGRVDTGHESDSSDTTTNSSSDGSSDTSSSGRSDSDSESSSSESESSENSNSSISSHSSDVQVGDRKSSSRSKQ